MRPPKPGLQNVLCSFQPISYLSSAHHTLLPSDTRPAVSVHAACGDVLVTAGTHVLVESPHGVIEISGRLHFRPLDIAVRVVAGVTTVFIAGADGALFMNIGTTGTQEEFRTLPGTAGYAIVSLAVIEDLIAAAAVDGRVAIWRDIQSPAQLIFDHTPLSGDRITDMQFVNDALVIAWWSGRLMLQRLCSDLEERTVWTLNAVCVPKHVFGAFSGSFVVVREGVVAMCTGRGDLVFVRLDDGRFLKERVGEYVKGFCEHDDKLYLVVDGKLITREWMSKEKLDTMGVLTSVKPGKSKSNDEDVANGDKPRIVSSQRSKKNPGSS